MLHRNYLHRRKINGAIARLLTPRSRENVVLSCLEIAAYCRNDLKQNVINALGERKRNNFVPNHFLVCLTPLATHDNSVDIYVTRRGKNAMFMGKMRLMILPLLR